MIVPCGFQAWNFLWISDVNFRRVFFREFSAWIYGVNFCVDLFVNTFGHESGVVNC